MRTKRAAPPAPPYLEQFDPLRLINEVKDAKGIPNIDFKWGYPKEKKGIKLPLKLRGKRRLIGHPNRAIRELHERFRLLLQAQLEAMGDDGKWLRILPSATGCVTSANPLKNSEKHADGTFLFTTDFAHAYQSVDLERLSLLLTFIFRHEEYRASYSTELFARNELAHYAMRQDPLYPHMESFVSFAFGGIRGEGLAVGGPLSPMLLNLYCEVFLDSRLRAYFFKHLDRRAPERTITYTRYVDDLVFSRGIPIGVGTRSEIRRYIEEAGFAVNDRKTTIRLIDMGTVFVTKVGMRRGECTDERKNPAILVFPQKKRRRIHGVIQSYLATPFWNDSPEVIRGIIAEFLHYYANVVTPTKTDAKTLALCKEFEAASNEYRKRYPEKRLRH